MYSLVTSPTVCVHIGSGRKKYILHEKLVRSHSSYLGDRIFPHRDEPSQLVLYLIKADAMAFQVIAKWLYDGFVPVPKADDYEGYKALVKAWPMAIQFGMEDCANTICESVKWHLDGFQKQGKMVVGSKILLLVNEMKLLPTSPCRRFIMDRSI